MIGDFNSSSVLFSTFKYEIKQLSLGYINDNMTTLSITEDNSKLSITANGCLAL